MRLLGRGFHNLINNVSFSSPTDVGSHSKGKSEREKPKKTISSRVVNGSLVVWVLFDTFTQVKRAKHIDFLESTLNGYHQMI